MAHLVPDYSYRPLVERLNKYPQGAPPSALLYRILRYLFSEKEARLVSMLPIRAFTAEQAGRAWKMSTETARRILEGLCRRALLVDIKQNGRMCYCLPPPMAGFFEFSFMRVRHDMDQKMLAELLYRYINVEEDFARALFARGDTQLGRVFVDESQIPEQYRLEVLDYERATSIIRSANPIGISLCYCRHKMAHLGRACDAPLEICMTLNHVAASLIRHGHARRVDSSEALDVLQLAYSRQLVQFGENVRQAVNFICNCCKCCCEAMIAARRFSAFHPVHTSNFLPVIDAAACCGCGQCAAACPVEAIRLQPKAESPGEKVLCAMPDSDICLGCGICARACSVGAVTMHPRRQRVVTPLNTAHRVVLMAVERGKLQEIIFDNHVLRSHRALAALLGAVLKMPPLKQVLAVKQLRSRYLETLVQRFKWQPAHEFDDQSKEVNTN